MKKFCITSLLIGIIILSITFAITPKSPQKEYLRLHIRANSNYHVDQEIKYSVRDVVVDYLTPFIAECNTKQKAQNMLLSQKDNLKQIIDSFLKRKGFNYTSTVTIKNEYFPTRIYSNYTLNEGYYDAIIIELGSGKGNNWWCVVYPPLCFTSNESSIIYRSKILEIIQNFYSSKD